MKGVLSYLLFSALGFISGSVMYSRIIGYRHGVDIVAVSSDGNPGTSNIMKHIGVKTGFICLALDFFKGFIPVFIAARLLDIRNILFAAVIVAPIIGSAFSPFMKGTGGKSIAVTYGCFAAMLSFSNAALILTILVLIFSFVLVIQPDSLRIIISALAFSFVVAYSNFTVPVMIGCQLSSALLIFTHIRAYNKEKACITLFGIGRHRKV